MSNTSVSIIGDIGGTHARLATYAVASNTFADTENYRCAEFPNLLAALQQFIASRKLSAVDKICLAVAAPLQGDWVDLTNNHWAFSRTEVSRQLGVEVQLINDFSAQVLSLKVLSDKDFHWLGEPRPEASGMRAMVGPGTGLGIGALTASGEVIPSEGGHISFAPSNEHEQQLLQQLWLRHQRVSVERILSGMGLENLYWANCCLHGQEKDLAAAEICSGARAGDPQCQQAVADFCAILGATAGDVALLIGAYAGVYLSGGMLPKMRDIIDESLIRQRFEAKGRYRGLCKNIPLALVLAEQPGLIGCAQAVQ